MLISRQQIRPTKGVDYIQKGGSLMVHAAKFRLTWIIILLVPWIVSSCSGSDTNSASLKMAPLDSMPTEVRQAPVTVQQAYQFAAANPETLTQIPCYCGCGSMGHTSNYACYISGAKGEGTFQFDPHALGCSICVDITLDTMRLLEQGKGINEIRLFVDQTYAQYGPSNMP
jgi:hypothetical protein